MSIGLSLSFLINASLTYLGSFLLQVKAVLFAVESNSAAVALQGTMAKRYMRTLDPMHTPPHNVAFMRILRLLSLAFHREYKRLITENAVAYGARFASSN